MSEMDDARAALAAYEYALEGDTWYSTTKRDRTHAWQETDGGFFRFDPIAAEREQVPYTVSAAGQGIAGLDWRNPAHRAFWDWLWPASHLTMEYTAAVKTREDVAAARAAELAAREV